ncbi:MAG TPA: hypothetical protein VIK02_00265 [Candidatus Anoxymicrobiaceae bacterium]
MTDHLPFSADLVEKTGSLSGARLDLVIAGMELVLKPREVRAH